MYFSGIEAFLAIVRTESINKAAESLHLSQATVSYRLKTLEQEMGGLLVERRKGTSKSCFLFDLFNTSMHIGCIIISRKSITYTQNDPLAFGGRTFTRISNSAYQYHDSIKWQYVCGNI